MFLGRTFFFLFLFCTSWLFVEISMECSLTVLYYINSVRQEEGFITSVGRASNLLQNYATLRRHVTSSDMKYWDLIHSALETMAYFKFLLYKLVPYPLIHYPK